VGEDVSWVAHTDATPDGTETMSAIAIVAVPILI